MDFDFSKYTFVCQLPMDIQMQIMIACRWFKADWNIVKDEKIKNITEIINFIKSN
jgi:hypothetical protein